MIDEGYIKFKSNWTNKDVIAEKDIAALNTWRDRLYDLGLLGVYPNGIGYGNISQRTSDKQFVITGTQTGNYPKLSAQHYAQVVQCDVDNNSLQCLGMTEASSESMSHYAVYQQFSSIKYVFHTHHFKLWKTNLNRLPTTAIDVPYGTPEMAKEIQRLFRETDVLEKRIFVMAGHEEGIFTFGASLEAAGHVLLSYFEKL